MKTDDLDLPSFEAIQAARTPTLRHVPAKAQHLWSQLLSRALATVAHNNDEAAWRELLMLPQRVLCSPIKGGKKHTTTAAAFMLNRMQRWQEVMACRFWKLGRSIAGEALRHPLLRRDVTWPQLGGRKAMTKRPALRSCLKDCALTMLRLPRLWRRFIPSGRALPPGLCKSCLLRQRLRLKW